MSLNYDKISILIRLFNFTVYQILDVKKRNTYHVDLQQILQKWRKVNGRRLVHSRQIYIFLNKPRRMVLIM